MLNFKVSFVICAIFSISLATIDADLEEENFRKLLEKKDQIDDEGFGIDSKIIWPEDENAENLPYESLDEFEKLRSNPEFPTDLNDETEDESPREKRGNKIGLFASLFPNKNVNKMDDLIRDTPEESPDNSKFHGLNVLNDLENEN